mmetsp:Transcript_24406/g.28734  ORF Transcript_24406/g.28734 Transcript_24406/m.28734 type:complete len:122 (+) Transcript_24406:1222-1587(+)
MVAPTFKALQDQLDFEKLVAAAWKELNKCLNKGVFYVSLKKRRFETVEFNDDGIAWEVIKVDYSMSEKEVMYWYYNIQQALEEDLSELEIEDALDEDPPRSLGPVERSRVSQVRDWLKDGG